MADSASWPVDPAEIRTRDDLAAALRRLHVHSGLTLEVIGAWKDLPRSGRPVSRSSASAYMNGRSLPPQPALLTLLTIYGVPARMHEQWVNALVRVRLAPDGTEEGPTGTAAALHTNAFVAGLDLAHYERRPWLTELMDRTVTELGSGYVLLEGEAGVGKSAFLVHETLERRWVHHYCSVNEGGRPDVALRNLARQLIDTYHPTPDSATAVTGSSSPSLVEGDAFHDLLRRCAERHEAMNRPGPLVLAIDGIEEAQVRNRMPLALPQSLPDNVVVVATGRQGRLRLPVPAGSRRIIHLRADLENNREDIRRHIGRLADEFADSLTSVGVSRQEFIELVADRVGGLWIYLRYIAADIRSGRRTLDDLGSLPQDLWQYYAETLAGDRQPGDSEPWYRWSLPLLGVLAAVRAPMTAELLGTYAGIPEQWRILDRLENAWPAFLSRITDESGTATYGVYHASVSDFVNGNVTVGDQTTLGAEAALADELRRAVHDAHERIADHHLAAWGGLAQGLPLLRARALDIPGGRYGIRYLVQHLESAGRYLDIHVLLRLGAPDGPENAWFACHEDLGTLEDYREHLAIGRQLAVARVDRGEPDRADHLALEIQYAMMDASLVESASGIPHNLLDRLVRAGLWSLEKALFYARRNNDAWGRCQGLLALAGHLPDPRPIMDEVLRLALQEDNYSSGRIMDALVKDAPSNFLSHIADVVRTHPDPDVAVQVLTGVASRRPGTADSDELISAALRRADECEDSSFKVHLLLRVADSAHSMSLRQEALAAAEGTARRVERPDDAVRALAEVAEAMDPGPARDSLFLEALDQALPIPVELNHQEFLYHMMPLSNPGEVVTEIVKRHLPEPLLLSALPVIRRIRPRRDQASALAALVTRMPPDTEPDVYDDILELAWNADPIACVRIAGMLPASMFDRAREIISCADDIRLAISASLGLLAHASDEHRATLVNDIGKLLRWVPDPGQRAGHLLETAELVREGPSTGALRDDVVRELGLLATDDTRRVLGQAHLVLLEPPGRQRDAHLDDVLGQIDQLHPELRLETLLRLVDVAPEDPATTERILTLAFAAARAVPRSQDELPYARDERRIRLMGVPGHRHRHADAWSVRVPDDYEQPWWLNSVLRKTPAFLLPLALEEIAKVPLESSWLGALELIAHDLPKDALQTALQVAWRRSSGAAAAHTLATASASLPGSRDGGLCATALDLALAIPYNDLRSRTLYRIAGAVARRLPDRVVEASRAVPTEYFTSEILRAGAEHASADYLEDILRAASEIPDAHWFAYAAAPLLGRLAPGRVRSDLEQKLRSLSLELKDQWARAAILTEIVAWADPGVVVDLLPGLRSNLEQGRWVQVGAGIASSDGFFWRELVTRVLRSDFPANAALQVLQDLMAAADHDTDPGWQAVASRHDALPADVREVFLEHAERLADVMVLAAAVGEEPEDRQEELTRRVLCLLRAEGVRQTERAATLLATTAPVTLLTDVAETALVLREGDRCFPLQAVVRRLPPSAEREAFALHAFNDACKGVDRFQNSENFAILGDLVDQLAPSLLPKAAALVKELPNEHGEALPLAVRLVAALPDGEQRQDLMQWIVGNTERGRDLARLIDAAPKDFLPALERMSLAQVDLVDKEDCLLTLYGRTGSLEHLEQGLAARASARRLTAFSTYRLEHALKAVPELATDEVKPVCERYLSGHELADVLCTLAEREAEPTVRTALFEAALDRINVIRTARDRLTNLDTVVRRADAIGVDIAWTARWRAAWPDQASNEGREALLAALTDNWPLVAEGAGATAPAIVSLAVADVLRWWP